MKQPQPRKQHGNAYLRILLLFSAWKFLLIGLALITPSPAYDTSTSLILKTHETGSGWGIVENLCVKLTRWDAIYFVKAAERGYVNEQEWAFGWGYVQVIYGLEKAFSFIGIASGLQRPYLHALSGILVSNISHFLSTLVLYQSTFLVFETPAGNVKKMAFITACLHIISPAGLFLSAPYSESLFSLLSFTGIFLYLWSGKKFEAGDVFKSNTAALVSAIILGLSCMVRSNGLLNGILFLHDFILQILDVIASINSDTLFSRLFRICILGAGGLIIGLGFIAPQGIAWKDYCTAGNNRPWCSNTPPSIYFYVQDHYWDVGMFRYWTLPNVPLFLLAAPMLTLMVVSGVWGIGIKNTTGAQSIAFDKTLLRKLAFPQLLLALMAIVTYHVQIITRVSSGYMVWYWWIAYQMSAGKTVGEVKRMGWTKFVVRYMVLYGIIQGVLFSGFLPPA